MFLLGYKASLRDNRDMRRVTLVEPEDIHALKPPRRRGKYTNWLPVLYRHGRFYKIDGRSREGILLKTTNNALLEQLNRRPTPAEKLLIERLSWLHLCIQLLDSRVLEGQVGYDEAAAYASHINSFSQGLANLGLLGNALTLPSLPEPGAIVRDASTRTGASAETREAASADD